MIHLIVSEVFLTILHQAPPGGSFDSGRTLLGDFNCNKLNLFAMRTIYATMSILNLFHKFFPFRAFFFCRINVRRSRLLLLPTAFLDHFRLREIVFLFILLTPLAEVILYLVYFLLRFLLFWLLPFISTDAVARLERLFFVRHGHWQFVSCCKEHRFHVHGQMCQPYITSSEDQWRIFYFKILQFNRHNFWFKLLFFELLWFLLRNVQINDGIISLIIEPPSPQCFIIR